MKDFFKYMFASLTGVLLAGGVLMMFLIVSLVATLMGGSGNTTELKPHSVLRIPLNGILSERYTESPLDMLQGKSESGLGLEQTVQAILLAKDNKDIDGIYIEAGSLAGATPAMLEEIRQAIVEFRTSGKPVICYGDIYSQGCYYICSAADRVALNPQGAVNWNGMAAQPIFFKDLLEKIGVHMQVFRVGNYKSAVEPYTSTSMSEANREQVSSYLHSIWGILVDDVASSRSIERDSLLHYADEYMGFAPAETVVERGLADTLCYADGMKDYLQQRFGQQDKKVNFIAPDDFLAAAEKDGTKAKDHIAVYYAFGDIVEEANEWGDPCIASSTVCNDLRELREDKNVKAVVIRVNSGGGSAYASEQIWREVTLIQQEKPVIVSMGGMAASGGYYISCAADSILVEPMTLTGSIGIFGIFPDASNLLQEKLGLHFDVVKTNELADFGTQARPLNATESELLQHYINRGYDLFVKRVADGRQMSTDSIHQLAQGRVWTGLQAVENGLADRCGNLQDAIRAAAAKSGLDKYQVDSYPQNKEWYETLLGDARKHYMESQLGSAWREYLPLHQWLRGMDRQSCIQARMLYLPNLTN
ncbi:MAG: signal peptide peptidase SppA [Clostridium sp.]|nr:signal peptide peptidase SppA [Clostridium sp.]